MRSSFDVEGGAASRPYVYTAVNDPNRQFVPTRRFCCACNPITAVKQLLVISFIVFCVLWLDPQLAVDIANSYGYLVENGKHSVGINIIPTQHPSAHHGNGSLCSDGVYWILKNSNKKDKIGMTCDLACNQEASSTTCAGDYPLFNGWPYTKEELLEIINTLDKDRYQRIANCNSSNVKIKHDDLVPEFYYMPESAKEDCSPFYIEDLEHNYRCNTTTRFTTNMLCPCCIVNEEKSLAPSPQPSVEITTNTPVQTEPHTVEPTLKPIMSSNSPALLPTPNPEQEASITTTPVISPTLKPIMSSSLCPLGVDSVYWVLAHSSNETNDYNPLSCNAVCSGESTPTICAGDYPTYSGWPYSEEALVDIVDGLDKKKYPHLVNCDTSLVMNVNDSMIPEFYYTENTNFTVCSPFFLMEPKTAYRCDTTPLFTTNILCPCCTVAVPKDSPTLLPTPNPVQEASNTSTPVISPTLKPIMSSSLCPLGVDSVYWVLAHSSNETNDYNPLSCNAVCSGESTPTICAGDYPTYSGWPYSEEALVDIVDGLDKKKYPHLVNCDTSLVMNVNDSMIPEFYYTENTNFTVCSPFFLMEPKTAYRCDTTPLFTTNILCPCCTVAVPKDSPALLPTPEPIQEILKTTAPVILPTIQPIISSSLCLRGMDVYWVLAHTLKNDNPLSCNMVCSGESTPTTCAGDYPTYSGWPYSEEALVDIVNTLDLDKYQRLANCDISQVMFLNNTMVPEFYYMDDIERKDECSFFFLMEPGFPYRCDSKPKFSTNMLCPCCTVKSPF